MGSCVRGVFDVLDAKNDSKWRLSSGPRLKQLLCECPYMTV